MVLACAPAAAQTPPGETPVDPYPISNTNAGAAPMANRAVFDAFHGEAGLRRIASALVDRALNDPRIDEVFKGHDHARSKRLIAEMFCYLLDGPCDYTGRDMRTAHKDLGIETAEFNALVEDLQQVMDEEHVPFRAQNKLLAKLAPLEHVIVTR